MKQIRCKKQSKWAKDRWLHRESVEWKKKRGSTEKNTLLVNTNSPEIIPKLTLKSTNPSSNMSIQAGCRLKGTKRIRGESKKQINFLMLFRLGTFITKSSSSIFLNLERDKCKNHVKKWELLSWGSPVTTVYT